MNAIHDQHCDCDECRANQYPSPDTFNSFRCDECRTPVPWGCTYCRTCANDRLSAPAVTPTPEPAEEEAHTMHVTPEVVPTGTTPDLLVHMAHEATRSIAVATTPTPEPAEEICQACAVYTDETRNFCEECGRPIPHAVNPYRIVGSGAGRVIALALALTAPLTSHTSAHVDPVPVGCTVVGVTSEQDEHFPLAHCTDGTYQYQDLDSGGAWKDATSYAVQRFSHH